MQGAAIRKENSMKVVVLPRCGYGGSMSDAHMAERAARAQVIIDAPQNYKVCEGCESIVTARVVTCPNCSGYRFNTDAAEVIAHAKALASRPQTSVTSADLES